jgi:L-methionine (R)-S-oxide reductase
MTVSETTTQYPENKVEKYELIHSQLIAVTESEQDLTANLANVSALLKTAFNWWWVGFYLVKNNQLVLGPFQGPVACTRIAYGKGVCGTAWKNMTTQVVADVHQFPGHIACSESSNSEIVVPIIKNNTCLAVLDADSEFFDHFDDTDRLYLEKFCSYLTEFF